MYLLDTALTKLLATLAAVMTVTAGLPNFQCRCPDGRVKLFCHGDASAPSGCCCATSCSSSSDAKPCCCEAKKANAQASEAAKNRTCCANSHREPPKGSGSDGAGLVVNASCCVKTVVAAPAVDSVEHVGTPVHPSGDTLVLWEPVFVPAHVAPGAIAARPPPRLLAEPPDLVIVLCHFTC